MNKFKKIIILFLIILVGFNVYGCKENKEESVDKKPLEYSSELFPTDSSKFSSALAKLSLNYLSGTTSEETKIILENNGFEILKQKNYDKAVDDPSHTTSFSIGKKNIIQNKESKELILVTLSTSLDNDWFSNFDFAPSHNDSTVFSENFLYCAMDVFSELEPFIKNDSLILVTGYSRGGACANLLGMLLNETYAGTNIYVYTFASPGTVRNYNMLYYNIFNIINESDIVKDLPFTNLGYSRLGYDIVLKNKSMIQINEELLSVLTPLCPSISSYYGDRHSLTSAGLNDNGLTMYEIAVILISSINSSDNGLQDALSLITILSEESDLFPLYSKCHKLYTSGSFKKMGNEHNFNQYKTLLDNFTIEEN